MTSILHSRYAPLLTHASLIGVTGAFYGLLLWLPFWMAFVPCVLLAHRIGVLVHEYIHGIPFVRYRDNHAVVTLWDGIMMTFGLIEVTRGMHLIHHRWLNVPSPDAPPPSAEGAAPGRGVFGLAGIVAALRHLISSGGENRRRKPYVKRSRMLAGVVLSLVVASAWVIAGRPDLLWRSMAVVAITIVGPMSFRETVEHNSQPGDAGFANEYRTVVPMFNVNRHIHHHEDPTVPWYLLQWRTSNPLPASVYFTYWVRKYVTHELVRMQPMPKRIAHNRSAQKLTPTPISGPQQDR